MQVNGGCWEARNGGEQPEESLSRRGEQSDNERRESEHWDESGGDDGEERRLLEDGEVEALGGRECEPKRNCNQLSGDYSGGWS